MGKGFTLAETLVTIGIIGVVAALTIPSLIVKHKEKETCARLKKAYSTISQAFIYAVQEKGTPDEWGMLEKYNPETHIIMANNFKPYMNVIQDCTGQDITFVNKNCFAKNDYHVTAPNTSTAFVINDGISLSFRNWEESCNQTMGSIKNVCGSIVVDINGLKKPNQLGYDIFYFYMTKERIVPVGTKDDRLSFKSSCDRHNSSPIPNFDGKFIGCAAWVIYNENMDYLHCDDLDWGVKNKCK